MRHQVLGKHLGRTSSHRIAMRRNMVASLFEHGTISTTREKAKFVKPFAEKLITLAKKGTLHDRRRAISLLQDRDICTEENGKETTVINKLFSEIGPQYAQRNGGYTRIINLPFKRIGDGGNLVLLQLVGDEKISQESKKKTPKAAAPAVEDDVVEETPVETTTEVTEEPTEESSAAEDTQTEEPVDSTETATEEAPEETPEEPQEETKKE
jgi:large subunit ribosomal protein L17